MRSAAARSGEATVPAIVAAVPPLLWALVAAVGASALGLRLARDREATCVPPLLQPLARANAVVDLVHPLLPSVRKSDARVRERGVAWRPLVPAPVSVGARLRNEPARVDRSDLLLRGRKNDVAQLDRAAARLGAARVAERIGGCMRLVEGLPEGQRPTGPRLPAVEIGAPRRKAIDRRERLTDMDMLPLPTAARMAGLALLIVVPRTAEAMVLVDTLTTRSIVLKVAAMSPSATLITAATSAMAIIMATFITAVTDTDRISPPTVMATEVMVAAIITASRTAVVDTAITTLLGAVISADSLTTATVLTATVMSATEGMVGAASAIIPVMAAWLSAITAVVVLDTSAIRDTVTAAAMDMRIQDSPATDIEGMADGATSPASIAGKVVAVSPIIITWFRHADTASAGIAAKLSSAGL